MRSFTASVYVLAFFTLSHLHAAEKNLVMNYHVDLTKIESDSFYVSLAVRGLTGDSAVFQFASTAPGTYEVEDVGRFVGTFKAFDASGKELFCYKLNTNQFVIKNSTALSKISYEIDDSYGSAHQQVPLPMCGSNLEKDNAIVNGQMVFGFFKGHQTNPMKITYHYPKDWKIGTALEGKNGSYEVESFDKLVDSPVLFGKLTESRLNIGGANVDIYCYSQNDKLTADSLSLHMKDMLEAADKFIGGLPVKRYVFLYHFRTDTPPSVGAWEHSYSSLYFLPEPQGNFERMVQKLVIVASHEFFHVVTPLNIHSEIIEPFNFETPVPSQHLWLYEGTTEWAAQMMQIRGGLVNDKQFFDEVSDKLNTSDRFDPRLSLVEMSLGAYGVHGDQYVNIYAKGALTAMILDMRLLELSKGKMGLRDVIKKLSKEYGPKKTFSEKGFFDLFVKMTYPEIGSFFDKYIKGSDPLPIKEYLAKAGYDYLAEYKPGTYHTTRGGSALAFKDGEIIVAQVDPTDSVNARLGIQVGDVMLKLVYKGEEIGFLDQQKYQVAKATMKVGEPFSFIIKRDGKEMTLRGFIGQKEDVEKHKVVAMEHLSKDQEQFRKWWLKYN